MTKAEQQICAMLYPRKKTDCQSFERNFDTLKKDALFPPFRGAAETFEGVGVAAVRPIALRMADESAFDGDDDAGGDADDDDDAMLRMPVSDNANMNDCFESLARHENESDPRTRKFHLTNARDSLDARLASLNDEGLAEIPTPVEGPDDGTGDMTEAARMRRQLSICRKYRQRRAA